jgi:hypothetical protein
LDLARNHFEKALAIAEKISGSYLKSMILNSLSLIDIEEGKYDWAEKKLDESKKELDKYLKGDWKKNNLV